MAVRRYPRLALWLHRRGIARTLSSSSGTGRPDVDYLLEARHWTPRWLVVWAARQNFQRTYPTSASRLHLAQARPQPVAADGSRRWSLRWSPYREG
ncbi:hypothetical protein OG481_09750 [Streptomyces longwoodensis]|uniref:hypothetical protein n=1 Tax=Streptomyces longwoodensis TaxID=68231 RepID=UPI002DDC64D4|nr:hypothetical protein [Streptomyces longwoodensis]WRY88800.1 hypothetical protein OG481_09750 [Streptomyces longwoodensis]